MAQTIIIKGDGTFDEIKKYEALKTIYENANTAQLQKLAKMSKKPKYKLMLNAIK